MKITVLCSSSNHPVYTALANWTDRMRDKHDVSLVKSKTELTGGDFLFLVSCSELIDREKRSLYGHTLVLHASDLPKGRGWSPHVWAIINGAKMITLSLLEAEDEVDSGRIWLKRSIPVDKRSLWYEVNQQLFDAEIELMTEAVERHLDIEPYPQSVDEKPSYYRKRTPDDSAIDPCQPIADQFDLLRMCDPERYPAWFEIRGQKYKIILEKIEND